MIFVLILENAYASSVAQTLDMLAAAAQVSRLGSKPSISWRVCSPLSGQVHLSNRLSLSTHPLPRICKPDDICIVPGLGIGDPKLAVKRVAQADAEKLKRWLKRAIDAKATIYASCSAVLLLGAAGLLAKRKVTTSWWLGGTLAQIEPLAKIDVGRMVLDDGTIVTAGAAMAQSDLMLWLIKRHLGLACADQVSRFVLASQRTSQATFMLPAAYTSGDEFVRRVSERLRSALPEPPSMKALAAEMAMTERTLARRVIAATGITPLGLLQEIRLHHAQQLLASSKLSVDEIAASVGYQDATALRRLVKKSAHALPSQFRRS
jgi:transcriptional regulator GlxA family with amidase domain